jgi:hypothetical protein
MHSSACNATDPGASCVSTAIASYFARRTSLGSTYDAHFPSHYSMCVENIDKYKPIIIHIYDPFLCIFPIVQTQIQPENCTMALGSTQPLTEMGTRNLPGGKGRPAREAGNLTAICVPIV